MTRGFLHASYKLLPSIKTVLSVAGACVNSESYFQNLFVYSDTCLSNNLTDFSQSCISTSPMYAPTCQTIFGLKNTLGCI